MRSAATLLLFMLAGAVHAHHSTAEYDRSLIHELEGVLVGIHWRNPHVMFTVQVSDSNGDTEEWELATGAVYAVERAGLVEEAFSVGERVRVAGWPSTERPTAMIVTNLLLPGGEEILFSHLSRNRWSSNYSGGQWINERVSREQRGLYRVWSVDRVAYVDAVRNVEIRLTPSAQAKVADSPQFDPCLPQGMPGVMLNPLPVEFVDRGDHIDLQLTTFAVLRRIHMTARAGAGEVPTSDLGYSVGQWEDDTLEVRTTRVGWPYVDDAGRPQTEDVEILERFSLVDDGNVLRYTQTVIDPASLVEPVTLSWDWIDIGEDEIEPLHCE